MNKSFLFIFCFIFCLSFSQNDNEIKVKGVILDKNTSESLPLANIVFQNLNGKMIIFKIRNASPANFHCIIYTMKWTMFPLQNKWRLKI